jgi:hypothetical protein
MKKVLIVLAAMVLGFVIFVATRPSHFKVARELTMKCPAAFVYANIADFHEWGEWSPWDKLDPSQTKTYGGADQGVGATYEWKGNDKVGEGSMKITEAQPQRIVIALDFEKPMKAHNTSTFGIMAHMPGQVMVTWTMEGDSNFMGKAFGVFMSFDKMIGDDFDRGLEQLRIASEGDARKAAEAARAEEKRQAGFAAAAAAQPTIIPSLAK